jgi:predicted protein tyrosine phosphatase
LPEFVFSTSRSGAEEFTWLETFAVISITDPQAPLLALRSPNLVARLDLQFWDLTEDPGDGRLIFTADMANEVIAFVQDRCAKAKMLLVHCEAGVSRATAIADALGQIFEVDVRHQNALFVDPNALVMRLMLAAAGK